MCPSSWKLYLDDFPFLGSSLAHLEPKLELFEFWEFGSWWLFVARLSPIYVLFAFKIFLLPVPTRPGTRPFLQVPDPSRPEIKNPYPSDPAPGGLMLIASHLGLWLCLNWKDLRVSPWFRPAIAPQFWPCLRGEAGRPSLPGMDWNH